MSRLLALPVLCIFLLAITGCIQAPFVPPLGAIYTSIDAPLDVDLDKTEIRLKQGTSKCSAILGLVSFGDCSTRKAAENGDITTINHADYSYTIILFGLVQSLTVKVYGE
jgi:hypothetical protein